MLSSKTINSLGMDVQIELDEIEHDMPCIRLRATVGETIVERMITIGSQDMPVHPGLDLPQLQLLIDKRREQLAETAASREMARGFMRQLK